MIRSIRSTRSTPQIQITPPTLHTPLSFSHSSHPQASQLDRQRSFLNPKPEPEPELIQHTLFHHPSKEPKSPTPNPSIHPSPQQGKEGKERRQGKARDKNHWSIGWLIIATDRRALRDGSGYVHPSIRPVSCQNVLVRNTDTDIRKLKTTFSKSGLRNYGQIHKSTHPIYLIRILVIAKVLMW